MKDQLNQLNIEYKKKDKDAIPETWSLTGKKSEATQLCGNKNEKWPKKKSIQRGGLE